MVVMIKKTQIVLLFILAGSHSFAGSLEDIYNSVRESGEWPNPSLSREVVLSESKPYEICSAKLIHSIALINDDTEESLQEAEAILKDVRESAPVRWQKDYSIYLEVILTGLAGDYEAQIEKADLFKNEVNATGMFSGSSEFIELQKAVFDLNPTKVSDLVVFLSASAHIKLDQLDKARSFLVQIDDPRLRLTLQNSITTAVRMRSEDKGISYDDNNPDGGLLSDPLLNGDGQDSLADDSLASGIISSEEVNSDQSRWTDSGLLRVVAVVLLILAIVFIVFRMRKK